MNRIGVHHLVGKLNCATLRCALTIRAGSMNDTLSGTAHLLEHVLLLFNKTSNHHNISVSGTTLFDRTYFFIVGNINYLEEISASIYHIFHGTYLEDKYINYAKEDVRSEIMYRMHDKEMQKEKILLEHLLHIPLKMPLGTIAGINNIGLIHLNNYYKTNYASENMCISIVGNIDIDKFIGLLNRDILNQPQNMPVQKDVLEDIEKYRSKRNSIDLYFCLDANPFLEENEYRECILFYLMCYAFRSIPYNNEVLVEIKELTKENRFLHVSINNYNFDKINKLLFDLYQIIKKYGDGYYPDLIQTIKNNILNEVNNMYNVLLLKRSIDFFVHGNKYYNISIFIEKIKNISMRDIRLAASVLLKIDPLVITDQCDIYETDNWRIQ